MAEPVKVIKVKVDVGSHYPEYDVTELQLWPDGSVTWLRSGTPDNEETPARS